MVSYEPFWKTLKEKGVTQYSLIKYFDFSSSLLDKMRNHEMLSLEKINDLCLILDCDYSDIIVFIKDPSETQYEERLAIYHDALTEKQERKAKREQKKNEATNKAPSSKGPSK